ncbi:Glycosyltransferase family 9 (heptosyltransferase) [Sphingomonas guangdongensis]|uniref:Glycosyltransferase family 9 (Heptosyltransferase) n=1 Tax=Sphingomonas guangdongensis TaxID=1141890 RepID=A0A285QDE2_9SPHN|nr:Glycosyltransferase family 9 (heptosyltransferase) [Sphingomonas guangdongensis]
MDGMAAWTAAMRAERWTDAWAIQSCSLAERDPTTRDDPRRPYHQRWVWDGTPVDGRDVLVRCYHGLGDTIMFARYLPLLLQRARSVTLEVQEPLLELLAPIAAGAMIVPFDVARPLPPADCDVEVMELGWALAAAPDAVAIPYLRAEPVALPLGTLGLNHLTSAWDPDRAVPAELLAPLCAKRPCIVLRPEATTLPVLNPDGCPGALADTAALIAGSALVVTVDTVIAHLAGALGVPTWVLLKHECDWRWNPEARTSPWYPSVRLYAQPTSGDWSTVVKQVRSDLRPLVDRDDARVTRREYDRADRPGIAADLEHAGERQAEQLRDDPADHVAVRHAQDGRSRVR